ncbi:MAG: ABC transporter substrate-binding protein [Deltaproteobacteria bacterium]|nr:ABC transporter substrate-binding protein [Deltaproteobacteria bacterium]
MRILLLLALLAAVPASAWAGGAPTPVRLQLKWFHAFQFAGYYAAKERGYYREAGLEVEIVEGAPDRRPIQEVAGEEIEFGVHDGGDLLYARLTGAPVVALAAVFQHSPYVILSLRESEIRTPTDLVGRTLMDESHGASPLLAMLKREGVSVSTEPSPSSVQVLPHTWRVDDLVEGRVDAMTAYVIDEPLKLKRRGIEVALLDPVDYGVDFYGDTLFTSEALLEREPERVEAFRAASMKGWAYAMAHPEELAELIRSLPTQRPEPLTRVALLEEAAAMKRTVMPTLVEIGHMNPGRWGRMASEFQFTGVTADIDRIAGFVPDPEEAARRRQRLLELLGYGLGALLMIALASLVWAQQLRRRVRQRTEAMVEAIALREEQASRLALLAAAVEQAVEDIVITDAESVIQYVNPAFEATTGYSSEEVVGKRPSILKSDLHEEAFYRELYAALARGEIWHGRFHNRTKEGRIILQDATIAAIRDPEGQTRGYVSARRDVTRQVALESQVEQSQRMQAIGTLAGGIAHDFNNVLAGVVGYTERALLREGNPAETVGDLERVQQAAERAADLTRQILAFSRRLPDEAGPLRVQTQVEEALKLVRATIPTSIDVRLQGRTATHVRVAPGDIERIVVNLCTNASLAIGIAPGRIILELEDLALDAPAAERLGLAAGDHVRLAVIDNGSGMSPEVQQRLFEPFFTTRKAGEGTGLGLSVVHGIVESRGGTIRVSSTPSEGSCFEVWLPACEPEGVGAVEEQPVLGRGSGSILLVDDEEMITSVFRATLEEAGYEVEVHNSGLDALEAFESAPEAYDLIITDLAMPRLRGDYLAAKIKAIRADVPVLLFTGNDLPLAQSAIGPGGVDRVLQKPLKLGQMLAEIEALLGASDRPVEGVA